MVQAGVLQEDQWCVIVLALHNVIQYCLVYSLNDFLIQNVLHIQIDQSPQIGDKTLAEIVEPYTKGKVLILENHDCKWVCPHSGANGELLERIPCRAFIT